MASDQSSYHIPNPHNSSSPFVFINVSNTIKLTATNYLSWRLQLQAILLGHDLLGFVDGSNPPPPKTILLDEKETPNPAYTSWFRQDQLLFGALVGTLSPTLLPLISLATSSKDIWDILAKTYATPTRGHIKQLKDQFKKLTKGTRSITEYLQSVKSLADQLASLGKPLDHEDVIDRVLDSLDQSFSPVIDAVHSRDTPMSLEELHEKLINRDLAIDHTPPPSPYLPASAFTAQTRSQTKKPSTRSNSPLLPTPTTPPSSSPTPHPFFGRCQWCREKVHVVTKYPSFLQRFPTIAANSSSKSPTTHSLTANTIQLGHSGSFTN